MCISYRGHCLYVVALSDHIAYHQLALLARLHLPAVELPWWSIPCLSLLCHGTGPYTPVLLSRRLPNYRGLACYPTLERARSSYPPGHGRRHWASRSCFLACCRDVRTLHVRPYLVDTYANDIYQSLFTAREPLPWFGMLGLRD